MLAQSFLICFFFFMFDMMEARKANIKISLATVMRVMQSY